MAAPQRTSQLAVNFDGLTDAITNLSGMLVLLVVMLVGVTREATPELTPPAPEAKGHAGEGEKKSKRLLQDINELLAQIAGEQQQIASLETLVNQLAQEVEELGASAGRPPQEGRLLHSPVTPSVAKAQMHLMPDRQRVGREALSNAADGTQTRPPAAAAYPAAMLLSALFFPQDAGAEAEKGVAGEGHREDPHRSDRVSAAVLNQKIAEAQAKLVDLRGRIPPLRSSLAEIKQQIDDVRLQKKENERAGEASDKPLKLIIRPPVRGEVKKQLLLFVCVDDKLYATDYKGFSEACDEIERIARRMLNGPVGASRKGLRKVPRGDFNLRYSLRHPIQGSVSAQVALIRKQTAKGQTADEIRRRQSGFQTDLRHSNRATTDIVLAMYPDSAPVFRVARELARQAGFTVRPLFVPAGKLLQFRPGEAPSEFYLADP